MTLEAREITAAIKRCRKILAATRKALERDIAMLNRGLRNASR